MRCSAEGVLAAGVPWEEADTILNSPDAGPLALQPELRVRAVARGARAVGATEKADADARPERRSISTLRRCIIKLWGKFAELQVWCCIMKQRRVSQTCWSDLKLNIEAL